MPARNHIAAAAAATATLVLAGASASTQEATGPRGLELIQPNVFSNVPGQALELDPNLVDAWGVAFAGGGLLNTPSSTRTTARKDVLF